MGFEIPQLNSCCCGCTLKTGTKIIGWFQLIGGIALVVVFGLSVAALSTLEDHPDKIPDSPHKKEFMDLLPILKILMYILITIALVSCGFAFILLLGVYQNKATLVFIWIVATLTTTLLSVLVTIGQLSYGQSDIISGIISFLLNIYFILVVYSYYREIHNVSNNCA